MTIERVDLPGVDDDTNDLLNGLLARLDKLTPRNVLRAAYYDGKRAAQQVGTIIPPQYYRMGIVLGWAGKAVDALARRCTLERMVWPGGDLDSLGGAAVWDGNHLRAEIKSASVSSLIHGPAFLVNSRGGGRGEPPAMIHVKDATAATGEWDPRLRRMENLVSIAGRDEQGQPTSLALYLDGRTITAERVDGYRWEVVDDTRHPWGVPVEPMVYKPLVGQPFGASRLSPAVMSLHDQAIRAMLRLEGHADVYSWPEMVMLGADAGIFKNPDGSLKSSWQILLGRIKAIPDDDEAINPRADVKQFPAASPEPHLAMLNALAKLFARETSLPDSAVAITDVSNPTSADSYDASQYELIAEAEGATDDWSLPVRRSYVRALAMANNLDEIPPEWLSIDSRWRDVRYESRAAQADAGSKIIAAAPWLAETEVGLELLGLDDQQIRLVLAERRRARGSGVLEALRASAQAVTGAGDQ